MSYGAVLGQEPLIYDKDVNLSDSVKEIFNLDQNANLEDLLLTLGIARIEGTIVKVQVVVNGVPAKAGILINNLTSIDGSQCITDDSGTAIGYNAQTSGTFNISTQSYSDLDSGSTTINGSNDTIQNATISLNAPHANTGDYIIATSNQVVWFSPYVTGVDVHVINGGQNGANGRAYYSSSDHLYHCLGGKGGDGGKQGYELDITSFEKYSGNQLVVGGIGKHSSFLGVTGSLATGIGGAGGTNVEDSTETGPVSGTNNTVQLFGSGAIIGSGGGGGGGAGNYYNRPAGYSEVIAAGGQNGGGKGGYYRALRNSTYTLYDAEDSIAGNYGAGGGGGGAIINDNQQYESGTGKAGQPGAVFYRWRVETA